jgi:hypothetical protein
VFSKAKNILMHPQGASQRGFYLPDLALTPFDGGSGIENKKLTALSLPKQAYQTPAQK